MIAIISYRSCSVRLAGRDGWWRWMGIKRGLGRWIEGRVGMLCEGATATRTIEPIIFGIVKYTIIRHVWRVMEDEIAACISGASEKCLWRRVHTP